MTKVGVAIGACLLFGQWGCGTSAPASSALSPGELPDAGTDSAQATAPPTVPTACDVTATLTELPGGYAPQPIPPTDRFSVWIDWSSATMITGRSGEVLERSLVQEDGWWSVQQGVYSYSTLRLRPTADGGCVGDGQGAYSRTIGDLYYTTPFTAVLSGVVDRAPPVLALPTTNVHPLDFAWVSADEALPPATTAELRDDAGQVLALTPVPASPPVGVSAFSMPGRALAFARTYSLGLLPAAVDLAGNAMATLPSITTLADPGLFAQDGFEGAINAYTTGNFTVVDSAILPVPSGNKAMSVAPIWATSCNDRFTVRMAVPSGATAVKLSYLAYATAPATPYSGTPSDYGYSFVVAVPNGSVGQAPMERTPLPSPWPGSLPGSSTYAFGSLTQGQLALPPDAHGEVIFDLSRHCMEPPTSIAGLILDDLRVE